MYLEKCDITKSVSQMKIIRKYGSWTILCLTSIVMMVLNYNTTSNVVNYTVLDVQELHLHDNPEPQGTYIKFIS